MKTPIENKYLFRKAPWVQIKFVIALVTTFLLLHNTTYAATTGEGSTQPQHTLTPENSIKITGQIIDEAGETLVGVSVKLKGTNRGQMTNAKGEFIIYFPKAHKNPTLSITYLGFKSREIAVKDKREFKITLYENTENLDEVVVTGIFNKPKESFTGAATKITAEELKVGGNRNILKSLSNLDPSFTIAENNNFGSDPNRLPDIQIRGTASMPTNMSDFQGQMSGELNTPLFLLDGFEITLERVMDLNNDEIESITILKDASATAIYGSRGTNGVVVITSVKPKQGKLRVSYNAGVNLEIPDLKSYNLMNASEKLQFEWDAGLYKNATSAFDDLALKKIYARNYERILAGVDTDWLAIPTQMGIGSNHYLGVSGGDQAFRYSLGFSYNNKVGAMKGSNRNTFNGNVNLSYHHKIFRFSNGTSFGFNNSANSPFGSFRSYVQLNPYWEPVDQFGMPVMEFESEKNGIYSTPIENPYYNSTLGNYSKNKYTNIGNNSALSITPIENLQINFNFSFNKNFSKRDDFMSIRSAEYITKNIDLDQRGSRSYYESESLTWALNGTLNYVKSFGDHTFTAGVNAQMRETNNEYLGFDVIGFVNDEMNGFNNAAKFGSIKPKNDVAITRHVGFAGTLNYSFKNRYYADFSYRSDGASSFGKESRFAPFWSAGVGWTISNEPFVRDHLPFITSLRAKYSYGVTGSMNFSPWQALGTYLYESYTYQGSLGALIRGLENKDLKWQDTYSQNLGFDFGVFDGRFNISTNLYHRVTKNAITDMSLPLSSGFEKYTGNSGEILNRGFDVHFIVNVIRDRKNSIYWSLSTGNSFNQNKLLKLSDAVKDRMNNLMGRQGTGLYYVFQEGQSVDAIYAVPTVGVDPSTGRLLYKYKDGSQSYLYDVYQRVVVGDRRPKVDLRIGSNFQFKGFSLYAGLTVKAGGQKYNETYASKIENVNITQNLDKRVLGNRWRYPGDAAIFTSLTEKNAYITDRYVQTENMFELNSLNISYQMPNKWLNEKTGLTALSFSASIGNVFYFSTIRQERGTNYPYAIQPTFGISCTL